MMYSSVKDRSRRWLGWQGRRLDLIVQLGRRLDWILGVVVLVQLEHVLSRLDWILGRVGPCSRLHSSFKELSNRSVFSCCQGCGGGRFLKLGGRFLKYGN
jgi:hypothetical protein